MALVASRGNFSALCTLSEQSKLDVQWWLYSNPDIVLQTDASSQGWRGVRDEQLTGGRWANEGASHHINYLELQVKL